MSVHLRVDAELNDLVKPDEQDTVLRRPSGCTRWNRRNAPSGLGTGQELRLAQFGREQRNRYLDNRFRPCTASASGLELSDQQNTLQHNRIRVVLVTRHIRFGRIPAPGSSLRSRGVALGRRYPQAMRQSCYCAAAHPGPEAWGSLLPGLSAICPLEVNFD